MKRLNIALAAILLASTGPLGIANAQRLATGTESAKPSTGSSAEMPDAAEKAAPGSSEEKAPSGKSSAVLNELLEISGTKRALQALPGTIGQVVMKSEKLNDAMSSALMEALSPQPFMQEVTSKLNVAFDPARAEALLAWYRSPLGKKIVALTESADRDPKEMSKKMTQLQRMPPPPERMALFEKLVKSDDPVGLLTAAAQSLFHGLMSFVTKVMPAGKVPPESKWKKKVATASQGSEAFVPLYAASFGSLSSEELQKYVDFATSADAVWFDKIEREAIDHGMRQAGERMGKAMIKFAMRIRGSL